MASFWKGFIRVTSTAVEEMLRSSGPGGISLWPKDNEYKPHQDFAHLAVHADDEIHRKFHSTLDLCAIVEDSSSVAAERTSILSQRY